MSEEITTQERPPGPSNPYVGPQQFEAGHASYYFGREREARDLLSVVIAHRLVLFYAPSGAGKSSLLKVRLIPGLRSPDVRYLVLPLARVGGAPPVDVGEIDNIYAFNAMSSIDGRKEMSHVFSHLTLKEFMAGLRTNDGQSYAYDADVAAQSQRSQQETARPAARSRRSQPPHVLILDQFEEIVTTHRTRWPEREEFFDQINQALEDDPQLWVVLSMRADYVSEIERYAPRLPNYPFVRFAMEHMDKAAASEAVAKPAAKAGRPMEADAVQEIVHNLLLVREQGKETQAKEGAFVQPVQLQVVCYQMWEGIQGESGQSITIENLTKLAGGDLTSFVDNALGDFYEVRLRQALESGGAVVAEAELRDWFSYKLITEAGTRGFLYKGETKTEGMPNQVVEILENKYLLRAEGRAGGYWYELVHDRFIEPIRARNNKWRLERMQTNPLLRRAHEWGASHTEPARRDERLLLSDEELKNLDVTGHALERVVHEFVEASRRAMQQRNLLATQRQLAEEKRQLAEEKERTEAEKRTSRRLRWAVGLAIFMTIGALIAWLVVFRQAGELETTNKELTTVNANLADAKATADASAAAEKIARKIAESATLADQSIKSSNIEDRLLLARAATTAYSTTLLARNALLAALDDGYRVDGRMTAYTPHERLTLAGGPWESLAFSGDGSLLALGDERGGVTLWDNVKGRQVGERLMAGAQGIPVYALAFDPTGPRLVSATGDRNNPTADKHDLALWDLTNPVTPTRTVLAANQPAIWRVAWSPDGRRLATAHENGEVSLWDLTSSPPVSRTLPGRHADWAYSVAFDRSGDRLASAGRDGVIILWSELSSQEPASQILTDHTAWVNAVAFSPDGTQLASGSDDGTLRLWDLTADPPSSIVIDDHSDVGAEAWDISFTEDSRLMAVGWGDRILRVYDLSDPDAAPWVLVGHEGEVTDVAFDPTTQRLVSLSDEAIVWDLGQRSYFVTVQPFSAPITPTFQAFSPNGRWLAVASADGKVVVGDREMNHPALSLTAGMTITALALSSDVSRLALAGCEKLLHETPSKDSSSNNTQGETLPVDKVAASAAPKLTQCKLTLWPLDSRVPTTPTLAITFTRPISALAFHPQEADLVAIGLGSGEVQTYDFSTSVATNLSPGVPEIVDLAFSSDGASLAALGRSGVVKIWDWSRRELVDESQPTEDGGQFDAIEFLHDDDWVAIASNAPQVGPQLELWERGSWAIVKKFLLDAGRAADLVYDQDEKSLFAVRPDSLTRWPMDEATWLELACTRAGRNLSYDAWRSAFPAAGDDEINGSLICKDDYPFFDISFAETLVKKARKAIDDCTPNQLAKGVELLRQAEEMKVHPPLEINWLRETLAVLGEQTWEYLRQPSRAFDEQAGACLELAAAQLDDAAQPTFNPRQALQAGQLLVRAEAQLADPFSDAGPIVAALENVLSLGAPWPDSSLQDQIWRLLPQAAYRLCQQGDNEGCRRFAEMVDLLEDGNAIAGEYTGDGNEAFYFMGQRGQAVTIAMNAVKNAFDALVRLEGPDGALTQDDDSGPEANSLIANYLLPEDAIYRIIPAAYSGAGGYTLTLKLASPRPIDFGVTVTSTTAQDSLWQFDGRAGQLVAIAMNDADPNFDPFLKLSGPDLALLQSDYDSGGNANALIFTTLAVSGTHFVSAEPVGGATPYTLRVFEPRLLPYDRPQASSTISDTLWVVEADLSQVISLTVTSGGAQAAPRLTLFSMDRVPFQQENPVITSDAMHIPAHIVSQDSGLIVQVSANNDRVPYTLTVGSIAPSSLKLGQPVTSTTQITPLWTFTGTAGQIIDIGLKVARAMLNSPNVELLDASGGVIVTGDSGGSRNARIAAAFLPADGQYFVRPMLATSSPIPYTLVMTTVTPPLVMVGEPFTTTLDATALLAFDGQAGQPIDLLLNSEFGEFADVALLNVGGQTLARTANNRIDSFILPQTGRYYLKMGGELDQATEIVLLLSNAAVHPIRPGEVFTTTTASDVLWTTEITKGQVLDISMMTTDPSFYPTLMVYGPDGSILSMPTDSSAYPNVHIKGWIAPATGRYILRAESVGSQAEYRLSLEETQIPEISFGETQTSNTQANELWRFTGQAGQVVDIDVNGWVRGGSFDPYISLLALDGSTLIENGDISFDDYNARIARFLFPYTGDYFIRIGPSGYTSPYRLSVTEHAAAPATPGSLHQVTETSAYTLSIDQPAFVQIAADESADLLLVAPGGDVLTNRTPALLRRLENTGTYTIGVSVFSDGAARALHITAIQGAPQPLNSREESLGSLLPGSVDLWSFPAGDKRGVRLAAQGASFTPQIHLWALSGELVGVSNQEGLLAAPLPAGDNFLLSVRAPDAQAGGVYTITLQPVDSIPAPQACNYRSEANDYAPLRQGSIVILGRQQPVNGDDGWNSAMNTHVGRPARVTGLYGYDWVGCPLVKVDVDQGRFQWRVRDMTTVE